MGETCHTLSWIWTTDSNIAGPEDSSDDILQSEWAKSRARAARATEEVLLLWEEMRRVLDFLGWKADWWTMWMYWRRDVNKELADLNKDLAELNKDLAEGLRTYAHTQADLQTMLSTKFCTIWKAPLDDARHVEDLTGDDNPNMSDIAESDEGDNPTVDDDANNDDEDMI